MAISKASPPDEGRGGLEKLALIGVGPAKHISLDLSPRLNIITGDNGLGKTFLLDCAWWAFSGTWADAENALIDTKQLQLMDHPDPEKVREVSRRLAQYLPDIDPFWPRWKYFAERNGIDL